MCNLKKILILGASGFIGTALLEKLRQSNFEVCATTRRTEVSLTAGFFLVDIKDQAQVASLFRFFSPDVVVNLVSGRHRQTDIENFKASIENDLCGLMNVVGAMIAQQKKIRLISIGTAEEYGLSPSPFVETMIEKPITSYSYSKTCQKNFLEMMHRLYKIPCLILRPSIAYGPGQPPDMFIPAMIGALINKKPFKMSGGEQLRDFIYIEDVVDALIKAIALDFNGFDVLNISYGKSHKLKDVALMIEEMLGAQGLVRLGEYPYRDCEIMEYAVDNSKAQQLLRWTPRTNFKTGIQTILQCLESVN